MKKKYLIKIIEIFLNSSFQKTLVEIFFLEIQVSQLLSDRSRIFQFFFKLKRKIFFFAQSSIFSQILNFSLN